MKSRAASQALPPPTSFFFADASVNVLNNTDSFAYIDEIVVNDSATSSTLGTLEPVNRNAISVYPNPSESIWNFDLANANGASLIEIIDITGKTVINKNLTIQNYSIDASGLTRGMYFAKITSGNAIQVVKVLKD